jgi:hypothetical protein
MSDPPHFIKGIVMPNFQNRLAPCSRRTIIATAIACATVAVSSGAQAHKPRGPKAPEVPASIQVPAGNQPYFIGQAIGTQNYSCLPSMTSTTGHAWTLFTPQALVLNRGERQIATHFFSPNPAEGGTIRAAWQHSDDSSVVWGKGFPPSFDPAYVAPGAIAWLLIEVKGAQEGLHGGDFFTQTTFIHRVNTSGGLAPATGCATPQDIGKSVYVPYLADYVFYRAE